MYPLCAAFGSQSKCGTLSSKFEKKKERECVRERKKVSKKEKKKERKKRVWPV